MSFVSKGEKKMNNKARKAGPGADGPLKKDSFGRKGDDRRPGAPHNMAKGSMDKGKEPVSEDVESDKAQYDASPVAKSEYDPASGKRAKSVADLRSAAKKINERSEAGEASPTGSEGGQDGKHSTSKNATGWMKTSKSKEESESHKKPRGQADQEADEMEDPMDEDQEDDGQVEQGMTPSGKSRKKATGLMALRKKIKELAE